MRMYAHKKWENTIHFINEGIASMASYDDGTLYRGLRGVKSKLKVGQTISFKDFSSASRREDVAEVFAENGILFEFQSWKNGADIASISCYPNEEEVLLAPYQEYTVVRIDGPRVVLRAR